MKDHVLTNRVTRHISNIFGLKISRNWIVITIIYGDINFKTERSKQKTKKKIRSARESTAQRTQLQNRKKNLKGMGQDIHIQTNRGRRTRQEAS